MITGVDSPAISGTDQRRVWTMADHFFLLLNTDFRFPRKCIIFWMDVRATSMTGPGHSRSENESRIESAFSTDSPCVLLCSNVT